jgi:ribosomal protein L37AE/L43A
MDGAPEKPSRNEEEYFAKRDAELIRAQREAAARAAKEAERQSHYMKCPKCGADLVSETRHGIQVDRCPECHGVWFDAGEVEQMIKLESRPGAGSLLAALMRGMRVSGASPAAHEPDQG